MDLSVFTLEHLEGSASTKNEQSQTARDLQGLSISTLHNEAPSRTVASAEGLSAHLLRLLPEPSEGRVCSTEALLVLSGVFLGRDVGVFGGSFAGTKQLTSVAPRA